MKPKQIPLLLLVLIGSVSLVAGCDPNDNPTDAAKMTQIRHKESMDRQNFNPAPDAASGKH